MLARFNEWRRGIAWARLVSYIIMVAVTAYAINDLYGLVETPATNEIQVQIERDGDPTVVFIPIPISDPRDQGGGGSVGGSSPSSPPAPSSGGEGGSGGNAETGNSPDGSNPDGGGSGGSPPPAPPDPPGLPNVPDILDSVSETTCAALPPNVDLPICP